MEIEYNTEDIKRSLDFETEVEYSLFYDRDKLVFEIQSYLIRYIQYKNNKYEIGMFDLEHPCKYVQATRYERTKRYVKAYEITEVIRKIWENMERVEEMWEEINEDTREYSVNLIERMSGKIKELEKQLDDLKINI